jgi:predicted GNAT family acetyltransferase
MDTAPYRRWRKAHEIERIWPETLLKKQEAYCVSACSRFKEMNFAEDHAWVLSCGGNRISALLLHSKNSLFPVFDGQTGLPFPPFLHRFLSNITIHALHGLSHDICELERILEMASIFAKERRDFNLMTLEYPQDICAVKTPKALKLRPALHSDLDMLTELQENYLKEEVLRKPKDYNRSICRLGLKKMIEQDKAAVAIIDGTIAGKINTNAFAFNRYQLGGVYVLPQYRGQGIGSAMTAAFARTLLAEKHGISLFVKKDNIAAETVYRRCGFTKIADYRIVYMQ